MVLQFVCRWPTAVYFNLIADITDIFVVAVFSVVDWKNQSKHRQRFKKVENQLRGITESFRCYAGGLDEAKIKYEEYN